MGYRVGAGRKWTNRSILEFAGDRDPVEVMLERSRELATNAIDRGWTGPPFDLFRLAELLKIEVNASGNIRDAQISVAPDGAFSIELNPIRPRVRQRFSLAHEIAHTLFADCGEAVRNRSLHAHTDDESWELEALCNIAAAEFLMPLGSMDVDRIDGSIEHALELRRRYEVSTEAVLIRTVQMSRSPLAMFSASRLENGPLQGRYQVDYAIESVSWNRADPTPGLLLAEDSPVRECTAIGYTNSADFDDDGTMVRVEAVGVAGYPGRLFPRAVGYYSLGGSREATVDGISFLRRDAIKPVGGGVRVIGFMTNNVTSTWGGGFAKQVAVQYPAVQQRFKELAAADPAVLRLGNVEIIAGGDDLFFAPIVAQEGLGRTNGPKIRYQSLETALRSLGDRVASMNGSVHLPRLGAGSAGGNWEVIREMIEEHLSVFVPVTVYDLPDRPTASPKNRAQKNMRLFAGAV